MFVINFSPNAVIPYADLAQLSGLGWEPSSQRKGRGPQIPPPPACSNPPRVVSQKSPRSGPLLLSPLSDLSLQLTLQRLLHLLHSICLFFTFP